MEKRALTAAAISILILLVYQYAVTYFYPVAPRRPSAEAPVAEATAPVRPPPVPPPKEEPAAVAQAPRQPVGEERRITVETELYRAVFVSTGARLESLRLKRHRSTVEANSAAQETIVPGEGGELPFGVELRGTAVLSDAGASYAVEGKDLSLKAGESGSVDFVWHADQVTIRKHFTFSGDRYEFAARIGAANVPPAYTELGVSWIKLADTPLQPGAEVIFDRAFYIINGRKLVEKQFKDLAKGEVVDGDLGWVGYAGRYFLVAASPDEARPYRLWLKLRQHTVEQMMLFAVTSGAVEVPLDIYVGPKDFDTLERVGHGLSRAVNLGFFSFIALPLLHVLEFSHRFTHNYGIDIILLTVLIKILFIPLTNRSFRSMREMQKLQPQMAKIREKFKDSPDQMNKEIMEMYRRHKVNPLGGCLPMVLQIPVFIGLYSALQNAVELRHAPFMLWINDLSAPDRLGTLQLPFVQHPGIPVLTLLMGVSMFLQQWMTPTAGDPSQQRVMMIMPLMFTFMFVNFPAGLVLYWLVNNILTIAQQYYMSQAST
jgi:YidC/Oxa1 family membrane protein insertase